jgi:hypothetical protein
MTTVRKSWLTVTGLALAREQVEASVETKLDLWSLKAGTR